MPEGGEEMIPKTFGNKLISIRRKELLIITTHGTKIMGHILEIGEDYVEFSTSLKDHVIVPASSIDTIGYMGEQSE